MNIEETPKEKVSREQVYMNESQIKEKVGENYNDTMAHRLKERNTFNSVFPSTGINRNERLYKTTNELMQPSKYIDPYHDEKFYFRMDIEKRFNEEMIKAKNMMMKKTKEVDKKPSK